MPKISRKTPRIDPASRKIPADIKRSVRQRCGFGCVICGLPLYEYEHMEGWANVKRHVASEIKLLCDSHHRAKTSGLLSLATVRDSDKVPFNLQTGVSAPYLLDFSGETFTMKVGTNEFSRSACDSGLWMVAISIDSIPLLAFRIESGRIYITLQLFDENDDLLVQIVENELRHSPSNWDITFEGRTLKIREALRSTTLEIEFRPDSGVAIHHGYFCKNGLALFAQRDVLVTVNGPAGAVDCRVEDWNWGINFGIVKSGVFPAFQFPDLPRGKIDRILAEQNARLFRSQMEARK